MRSLLNLPTTTGLLLEGVRWFAGRTGGHKSKKIIRNGRPVQTGEGRRMEFFWPKHSHRTRVPLYQNIRKNLVFDNRLKRWMVMWYRHGIQVFRQFSCKKQGFELARTKAIVLLRQKQLSGHRPVTESVAKPEACRSGVRGVYFDQDERLWVAVWNQNGIRRFRAFPALQLGFDVAYRAAVAVRKQKLAENYQFAMQRMRKRSGRVRIK
eukprot:GHVS01010027.1.p1 GENE.GHVS01010027.1~~GHVS01010027.1.p1  ORF type:complete len:209 (+),score=30.16 GHVS01010027.1:86-712(+)